MGINTKIAILFIQLALSIALLTEPKKQEVKTFKI